MRWQYDSSVGDFSSIECFREMDQILQINDGRAEVSARTGEKGSILILEDLIVRKDDEKRVIKKNLKELEMMIKDTQKVSRILAKYDDEVSFMPLLGAVFSTWCDMHEIVLSERWKLLKKLMEVQDTVNMMTDVNITNGFPGMEGFYDIEANLVVCDDEEKK